MKTTLILIAAAVTLSACEIAEVVAVDTGREAAKSVVRSIVADTEAIPAAFAIPITDCIIDNASGEELFAIGVQGATPENITLVSKIFQRPETVTCATSALT